MDAVEVDRRVFGPRERELLRSEVVFAEEVVQLELAGVALLAHPVFFWRECGEVAQVAPALVVRALVGRADAVLLPPEESVAAVRAPVSGLAFASGLVGWRGSLAYFALDLGADLPVVEVEILCRSIAMGAGALLWRGRGTFPPPDDADALAGFPFVFELKLLPVARRFFRSRVLGQRRSRIHTELPVVGRTLLVGF